MIPFIRSARHLMTPAGHRRLTWAMISSALAGLCEAAALLVMLPLITALLTGAPSAGLGFSAWLWVLIGIAAAGAITRYVEANIGYLGAGDLIRNAHRLLGDQLARLPIGWFSRQRSGELSRLTTSEFMTVASAVAHTVTALIRQVAAVLTVAIGTWLWDWRLGLVFLISAPVAVLLLWGGTALTRAAHRVQAPSTNEVSSRIVEYAACQPALRAAGRAESFTPLTRASAVNDRARFIELWLQTAGLLLSNIALQAIAVGLIIATAWLLTADLLTAVAAVTFVGLALRFTRNLQSAAESLMAIFPALPPMERALEIMQSPVRTEPHDAAALPVPGEVRLEDVSFGYRPDAPVLTGISFTAAPATMTAIVGPSGSGKTTIARLIAGFWQADSGTVSTGGTPISAQTTEQLMAQLGIVFQDVYLFDDTLEANIRIGRPDASEAEVREAADLSGVTEIAGRLPGGWQARVGEGGRALSGGERQRVSIARALLKRAPIVLFDEATSALDAENEANVLASIDALRDQSSTIIVIAHKLSTIARADQIIVLSDTGTIAETGTHDELYAAGGAYRRYWDHRQQAAGWRLTGPRT